MCTQSSLREDEVKELLEDFLEGRRSLSQIQEKLHDCLQIDFHLAPAHREIVKNELDNETLQTTVKVHHLRHMLQRYLDGEVSELELSNWAALIYMLPIFVPEGETDEDRWAAGSGPTWSIIQELVTPTIFAGLQPDVVDRYLDSLA
jgi:hypothetical protein